MVKLEGAITKSQDQTRREVNESIGTPVDRPFKFNDRQAVHPGPSQRQSPRSHTPRPLRASDIPTSRSVPCASPRIRVIAYGNRRHGRHEKREKPKNSATMLPPCLGGFCVTIITLDICALAGWAECGSCGALGIESTSEVLAVYLRKYSPWRFGCECSCASYRAVRAPRYSIGDLHISRAISGGGAGAIRRRSDSRLGNPSTRRAVSSPC